MFLNVKVYYIQKIKTQLNYLLLLIEKKMVVLVLGIGR